MNPVSDQTLYAGSTASPVAFTGTPAGTYFNWINYNPSIGLGPNGTGNIPSFTAINPENAPAVARIGVFPLYTSSGVSGLFLRNLLKQFGSLNNKLKC